MLSPRGDSLVDTDFVLDMMDREQLEVFHSEGVKILI